jgi:pimeloyl-ACP methyl ester carboxylesterase
VSDEFRPARLSQQRTEAKEDEVLQTESRDGTTIAFDRSGDGPPIVLVGGAFQTRADTKMRMLAELLAVRFTVINYDRRGRGDSGDAQRYAVELEIEDLEALLREVDGRASLFGMSSGGALVLQAAAYGLEIERVGVFEPPYMVDASAPRPPADHEARLDGLISAGDHAGAVEFFITEVTGMPAEAVGSMRASPVWPELEQVAPTLVYDAAVMGDYSLPVERIASVRIPALVLAGGSSDRRLRRAAEALWATLPDAQHRTLEGQNHDVAPDAIAPVLDKFFAASDRVATLDRAD